MTTPSNQKNPHQMANRENPVATPSSSLTFKAVSHDVASWWCYAFLKKGDLKLFDELDDILNSLPGPFPASSALSIRLRCLVPWQELLKQLYTPGCTVGEKQFETVQDKLLLLHQDFFSKTSAAAEFNDVLRMVQTHSVLSKLYNYFSKTDDAQNEQQTAINKVLDQCNAEWGSIYLESDGVPPSLLDLVDTTNGWDFEDRRDHIIQIVSFPESALTYKRLKKKMQSLLLHWFEHEITDSNETGSTVPELLKKRYRGIGYGSDATFPDDTTKLIEKDQKTSPREQKSNAVAPPSTQQPSGPGQRLPGKKQEQQVSEKKRNDSAIEMEKSGLALNSSDSDSWSDFDQEEDLRRLKLNRERKKKPRSPISQQTEKALSMPVGEPSYSSPERKGFRGRDRGRFKYGDYRHHSSDVLSASEPSVGRKRARGRSRRRRNDDSYRKNSVRKKVETNVESGNEFWDSDDSSSSDFDVSDGEFASWTREEDDALKNGIQCNGYGNWIEILNEETELLGSKNEDDLRKRANLLLRQR